jgi:hypothetical protein
MPMPSAAPVSCANETTPLAWGMRWGRSWYSAARQCLHLDLITPIRLDILWMARRGFWKLIPIPTPAKIWKPINLGLAVCASTV